jgi:hypothetical protein
MARNVRLSLFVGLAMSIIALPAFAGGAFPQAGQYVIHSHPSFLVTVGDQKEVVECDAALTLSAGTPYVTQQGNRRVDLKILDWKATGTSKLLGGPLNMRFDPNVKVGDDSFVETYTIVNAKNAGKDFPAKAQFAVGYQIDTPFGTVAGLRGVTRGSIHAFPPENDIFTMEKGDVAKVMGALMPAQLSSMSAAGEVSPLKATITAIACACPTQELSTAPPSAKK